MNTQLENYKNNDLKSNIQKIYSLSPAQEGILYSSLIDNSEHAHCVKMLLSINGKLDLDIVRLSFNKLIERHDVFRTVFVYEKVSNPMQVVFKKRSSDIEYYDITSSNEIEKKSFIEKFLENDKGFNLTKDILFRFTVIKLDNNSYKLIWRLHHIIVDGWCIGILVNDFIDIYITMEEKGVVDSNNVYQYCDYIKWLEGQDSEEVNLFWSEYLDDYKEQATLNSNKIMRSDEIFEKEIELFSINENLKLYLEKIAAENNTSISTIIQTLWGILLQNYNNSNDVVFGTTVSGRPHEIKGIENVVGLFSNIIPIRIRNTDNKTFIQLIKEVQEFFVQSENYIYYPLTEIQTKIKFKGALVDHFVVFENYPDTMSSREGRTFDITIDDMYNKGSTINDICIYIIPDKELLFQFEYNTNKYNKNIIKKIEKHYKLVVEEVIKNPNILVNDINILTKDEKDIILSNKKIYKSVNNLHNEIEFDEPVNEIEKKLIHIWESILCIENISVNDHFQFLGGNSHNAVTLVSEIYKEFGVEYPFMFIFGINLREMAEYIEKGNIYSTDNIYLLNDKKKKNIFAFPAIGSFGVMYQDMAKLFNNYSFYAFDFIENENRINEYVRMICKVQNTEPYIIFGYSAGASLAFEVVKELNNIGREVSHLILFDPYLDSERSDPIKWNKFTSSNQGFENHINRKIKSYFRYLNNRTLSKIKTNVYLIYSNTHQNEEYWYKLTNGITSGNIFLYKGFGSHDEMIMNKFIDQNVEIMEEILQDSYIC